MSGLAPTEGARLIGRLAGVFLDPLSALAPDRCGVGPFAPATVAGLAPSLRAAVAEPLAAECGLAGIDVPAAFVARLAHDAEAQRAAHLATLSAEALVALARALGTVVYADLARRLVRKADRDRFAAALGPGAINAAARRGRFHAQLAALAPADATIADADRPALAEATPDGPWRRPATSALLAGEPPIVRHGLALLFAWVEATEPALGAIMRARFGTLGPAPDLAAAQRAALGDFIAQRLD